MGEEQPGHPGTAPEWMSQQEDLPPGPLREDWTSTYFNVPKQSKF